MAAYVILTSSSVCHSYPCWRDSFRFRFCSFENVLFLDTILRDTRMRFARVSLWTTRSARTLLFALFNRRGKKRKQKNREETKRGSREVVVRQKSRRAERRERSEEVKRSESMKRSKWEAFVVSRFPNDVMMTHEWLLLVVLPLECTSAIPVTSLRETRSAVLKPVSSSIRPAIVRERRWWRHHDEVLRHHLTHFQLDKTSITLHSISHSPEPYWWLMMTS